MPCQTCQVRPRVYLEEEVVGKARQAVGNRAAVESTGSPGEAGPE